MVSCRILTGNCTLDVKPIICCWNCT